MEKGVGKRFQRVEIRCNAFSMHFRVISYAGFSQIGSHIWHNFFVVVLLTDNPLVIPLQLIALVHGFPMIVESTLSPCCRHVGLRSE